MKGRVLITGGAGFIGSHTADALSAKGYKITILDNLEPAVHDNRWPRFTLGKGFARIKGDVRHANDWRKALKGVSYVFHFAAYQDQRPDFSKFFATNTVGTALLYELIAAKKLPVKKVVVASSQFVYGDGRYECRHTKKYFFPEPRTLDQLRKKQFDILCVHGAPASFSSFQEDQLLTPTNAYGLSKQALENLSLRFGKTYGVPTVVLRYSIVQGPRQSPRNLYSGALRIFVTQALKGQPITVYEDGEQRRDFVNIEDVVAANLLVLKDRKTDFEIFNVGGGKAYTIIDFAKLVKKMTDAHVKIVVGGYRRTDTRHAVSDISKLRKLGWRPRFAPEKSVRDYLTWYTKEFLRP